MPRRRSTKGRSNTGKAQPVNRADAKVAKWNKASDVPMDKEDLFHANRDKVLLDGDNDYEDDGDDDEVFALKGLEDDEDEDEDGDVDMDEDEDEDEAEELPERQKKGKDKSKKKKKKKKGADSSEEEESEEEEETWGRSKAAWYSSNAAQLESDDEEGNELEEQEAIRLQSKQRQDMTDADFGLDDALEVQVVQETEYVSKRTPVVIAPLPTNKKLLLRHLEKTSPETLALARDWEETVETLAKTQQKLARLESEDPDALSLGMIHIYYQALLTYTTTLAFYLHMRSSEKYAQRPELLKSHPILKRLLTLKQSLATLEDLDFDDSDEEEDEEEDDDDDDDDEMSMSYDEMMADAENVWDSSENVELDKDVGMDEDELELLLEEAAPQKKSKPTVQQEPPKKKRKTSSTSKAAPIFDLVEPEFAPSKPSSSRISADTDAYGEATSLQHADVADKTARKKSLRFHTSRIESTSARRQGARNQAVGGDDDIPYRERKKEKDVRLAKENSKLRGQGGADLDDAEPEPKTAKRRREDEDGDEDEPEGPDGYYELVKKKTKEKKDQKKAEYDAMVEAARPDFDEGDATGPRSLTRAILANKGLTPHRPKSVRNPRVKKRLKFEKAKKKLSSQKATFKGGLADTGRYDGEKSGISKVVKSVRLG
ncbi:hypothetical protein DXG03_004863 [Asterophora parasitica]|uniref:Sas10 C-terminal domain-containing protein n=1 Tax=Asterophora parasitica TaxID=117018 RepID=A0A9P7GE64_9AGAR|nr:hypothetical protein DXG03_004863 [Asterophora parasitica]